MPCYKVAHSSNHRNKGEEFFWRLHPVVLNCVLIIIYFYVINLNVCPSTERFYALQRIFSINTLGIEILSDASICLQLVSMGCRLCLTSALVLV